MSDFYVNLFFLILNNGLYLVLICWFIKYRFLPKIRASRTMQDESRTQLSTEVSQQRTVLQETQEQYHTQTREVARLTAALEKWAGVLSQRAVTVEQTMRELSFRYRNRCAENARARALQQAQKKVTTQVLKNVRALLVQEYKSPAKQHDYIAAISHKIRQEDGYDRA